MTKRTFLALCFCGLLLAACGAGDSETTPGNDAINVPEHVPGLKVDGERTEANVIYNMWPVVCRAQELYRERLNENPKLKGTIELKMLVEFNGEIEAYSIAGSDMDDKKFETQVLRLFQFMDFNPYGSFNSETEFLYPLHFKP